MAGDMDPGSRLCILNPTSGMADHSEIVTPRMEERGFDVRETESADHAVELGREAGESGVSTVAVCGGDGTINDVLCGLHDAGALSEVTFSIIPAGTANLLARNLAIGSIDEAIEVADEGEVRSVDLGMAGDEPFIVSCIAGLPADASTSASGELKERLGTLAFVVTAVEEALEFDGLDIRLETEETLPGDESSWAGEALCVLVGNARKFVDEDEYANMEDGRFDVVIVERMPASSLVAEAIENRLLGREDLDGVTQIRAREVHIESDEGPITFSRDGEVSTHDSLEMRLLRGELDLRVGDGYDPAPQ